ncbi:hypothetical protein [Streptomyces odonnellii]|uniref:hypothetical protein n=1 Tax=Streptomyces odonnellii TaxID=1417980 RepID=UPI0006253A21|nr:hypothetical protein [Streptomyces odonnellii]
MATQTDTSAAPHTFTALHDCFTADLAALIEDEPPQETTPNAFIDLVERVRDDLATSGISNRRDASEELDHAVTYLTDALTSHRGDRTGLLVWARTHLRDALSAADLLASSSQAV